MIKRDWHKRAFLFGLVLSLFVLSELFSAAEYDIVGRVESLRKDKTVILLFNTRPAEVKYFIVRDGMVIGQVDIITIEFVKSAMLPYRAVAGYTVSNKNYSKFIRAGSDIGLMSSKGRTEREYTDYSIEKVKTYRPIVVGKDRKEMVLIPAGNFIFGSDKGDRDESPEQIVTLDNYYIDKFEVSNREYKNFIDNANSAPPLSWEGGAYKENEADLPVLVSYSEAEAYARWAGKRLPTEQEWEKAARGTGMLSQTGEGTTLIYPWGNKFDPEKLDCADFWSSEKIGAQIKLRLKMSAPGPLPIGTFDPEGASPYGVVNMAGNAKEWTSSWYMPYKGNASKKGREFKRYGTQYKVVRGGSWYSSRYRARVSSREIGGTPNLYTDNLPGFRCARDVGVLDLMQ
jgi:formylglycine-generating enzyme required for sulfatase activity